MEIRKIVVTGGPCAGKSEAAGWLRRELAGCGARLLFVPETATELISGGVAPWTCSSPAEYQRIQIGLQLAKERAFERAAAGMDARRVVLVCDRGVPDCLAYMPRDEYRRSLAELGLDETAAQERYFAVFHLTSAARGAPESYTLANNPARTETAAEAAALDRRIEAAWAGHPRREIVACVPDFSEKMARLTAAVRRVLAL